MQSRRNRNILFVTGTRADFGKIKPLLNRIKDSSDFDYHLFVTGMHMHARYGSTLHEITKAGFHNIYPYINQDGSTNLHMDQVLASTIQGISHYVSEFPPDLIVIHGDRVEALAGALVGTLNNVLVAHIEGGELSGTVDEILRHSISKLSHIHFVTNTDAYRRLIQMGEDDATIYVIGSPEIDIMLSDTLPSEEEVKTKYEIPYENYAIFIYHPVTTELDQLRENIHNIVAALRKSDLNFVVIYPNNDLGGQIIFDAIQPLAKEAKFRLLPSMGFEYFLTLLRHSTVIVGNSSSGVREAPVYGVPTVNIGTRQRNRFKYQSIIDVAPETEAILYALGNLPTDITPSMHFGRGQSAQLFLQHLQTESFWETSRQKQFRDILKTENLV